jgi:hypothetical protein
MKAIAICLGVLAAGWWGSCDPEGYRIDGVSVVLEDGYGPRKDHMTLAVEKYRQEAALRWRLTAAEETPLWRALHEIRWTVADVPDQIEYISDTREIRAMWLGCALDVALYQAFTEHYVRVVQKGDGPTDDDRQWAQELEEDTASVLCDADS